MILRFSFSWPCKRNVGTGLRKGSHAREPGADREPKDGLF